MGNQFIDTEILRVDQNIMHKHRVKLWPFSNLLFLSNRESNIKNKGKSHYITNYFNNVENGKP